jgi:hypothetical protein
MLNIPLIVFAVTAVLGLLLAAHVLRGKLAPWSLSPVHALLGATGLALMLTPLLSDTVTRPVQIGFALLLAAALLGFVLVSFHLRRKLPPKLLVFAHAGAAVSGFLTLLAAALQ